MPTLISDIDGTVLSPSGPNAKVIAYIKSKKASVIFLTNRNESSRTQTVSELRQVGIKYKELIMNDGGEPAPTFKKRVVSEMIKSGQTVTEFIDDRGDIRKSIKSLGVKVTDPSKISGNKYEESKASYSKVELIDKAFQKSIQSFCDFVDTLEAEARTLEKINVPEFIRNNARRGLELNKKGYGGDGLTDKTKAEARDMANGKVSLSKCIRMSAWFARHRPDTKTDGFKNTKSPDYPSAGLVAWLLWGGDSNGSMRAAEWADKQVERFSNNK